MTPRRRWAAGGALGAMAALVVVAGAYRPVEAPAAIGIAAALVAALVAGATAFLAVTRPWTAVLLLAAGLPIVDVARAQATLGPIQVLPVTVVIVALAVGAALQPRPETDDPAVPRSTWLALAAAAGLAVAATLVSPLRASAANITLHGVLEPMALFAAVLALRPSLRQLAMALLALGAGVVVATLVNFMWLLLVVGPRDLYEQRMLFARLTYFNVGIFATVLVMAIPAVASAAFGALPAGRWRSMAFAWVSVGVIVLALFFTYTKSAWLAAALVAAGMVLLLVRRWRHRICLLVTIAILLAVVVPYPLGALRVVAPNLADAYQGLLVAMQGEGRVESWDPDTYDGSGSIGIRLEAIGAAAQIAASAPLLGVGPGGFQGEFARIRPNASVPELQSAHNLLPNVAAEYGVPFALLVAIGLVLVIWRALGLGVPRARLERVTGTAVGLSLIGFLAMASLFGTDLYRAYRTMNADVVAAALLAGLAWAMPRRPGASGATSSQGSEAVGQDADLGAPRRDELGGARPG